MYITCSYSSSIHYISQKRPGFEISFAPGSGIWIGRDLAFWRCGGKWGQMGPKISNPGAGCAYLKFVFAKFSVDDNIPVKASILNRQFSQIIFIRFVHPLLCSNLPKTRSGKIMRRLLRLISNGKSADLGDISTLADPSAVDEVLRRFNEQQKR